MRSKYTARRGLKKMYQVRESLEFSYGFSEKYFNLVRVRSRRGQIILQFLFVSGHGGAKNYFNFCSGEITAGSFFFVFSNFKFQLARAGAPPLPTKADRRPGPAPALANLNFKF